jgi:hypothetical protein
MNPIAAQNDALAQDTDSMSPPDRPGGAGIGASDQALPSHL